MNRKRLQDLLRILRRTPDEHFNIGVWRGKCANGCGTAACAFGSHALAPEGRREGLRLIGSSHFGYAPGFKGREGLSAAQAFYDIDRPTAFWLFMPDAYSHGVADCHAADVGGIIDTREVAHLDKVTTAHVASRVISLLACG